MFRRRALDELNGIAGVKRRLKSQYAAPLSYGAAKAKRIVGWPRRGMFETIIAASESLEEAYSTCEPWLQ